MPPKNRHTAAPPPEEKAECGFVGLQNQGATCYLNSLIQSMYMTPELRHGLFGIDPADLGVQFIDEEEAEEAKKKKSGEVEPDENMLEQLKAFGFPEFGAMKSLISCKNASVEGAMDYCLAHGEDSDFNDPPPGYAPANGEGSQTGSDAKKKKKPRVIPLELQSLFCEMQCLQQKALSTNSLTTKGFQWQGMDGRVQHDAHELNRLLIDAVERSLKKIKVNANANVNINVNVLQPDMDPEQLMAQLYKGGLAYQTLCSSCGTLSERSEDFYDLNVQVLQHADLVSSLRTYVAAETLEGDSAYHCEVCDAKVTARRGVCLKKLPPILTLSCNRFKIDASTQWQREKVVDRCEFPLLLDMDRFVGSGVEVEQQQGLGGEKREKVEEEEGEAGGDKEKEKMKSGTVWAADAVRAAIDLATRLTDQYRLSDSNKTEKTNLPASVASLSKQDQEHVREAMRPFQPPSSPSSSDLNGLNGQSQNQSHLYELQSVIMHRGSAYSGHYFAYIRDCMGEGQWSAPTTSHGGSVDAVGGEEKQTQKVKPEWTDEDVTAYLLPTAGAVEKADGGWLVKRNSALGNILTLLVTPLDALQGQVTVQVPVKPWQKKRGNTNNSNNNNNSKPSEANKDNKGSAGASGASYGHDGAGNVRMSVDALGQRFKPAFGQTWTATYKPKHDNLHRFVRHPQLQSVLNVTGDLNAAKGCFVQPSGIVDRGEVTSTAPAQVGGITMLGDSEYETALAAHIQINASNGSNGPNAEGSYDYETGEGGGGSGSNGPVDVDAVDEDEALARALQDSLNLDEKEGSSRRTRSSGALPAPDTDAADTGAAGDWVSAGKKQKKSGKRVEADVIVSSSGSPKKGKGNSHANVKNSPARSNPNIIPSGVQTEIEIDIDIEEAVKAQREAEASVRIKERHALKQSREALAADILKEAIGCFYEFDDSTVRPMHLKAIERAFQGRDSAYILVYRRVSADKSGRVEVIPPPVPPEYWWNKVKEKNAKLDLRRQQEEERENAVRIRVHCPWHFLRASDTQLGGLDSQQTGETFGNEPVLRLRSPGDWGDLGSDAAGGGEDLALCEAALARPVEIVVDRRLTLSEVQQRIREALLSLAHKASPKAKSAISAVLPVPEQTAINALCALETRVFLPLEAAVLDVGQEPTLEQLLLSLPDGVDNTYAAQGAAASGFAGSYNNSSDATATATATATSASSDKNSKGDKESKGGKEGKFSFDFFNFSAMSSALRSLSGSDTEESKNGKKGGKDGEEVKGASGAANGESSTVSNSNGNSKPDTEISSVFANAPTLSILLHRLPSLAQPKATAEVFYPVALAPCGNAGPERVQNVRVARLRAQSAGNTDVSTSIDSGTINTAGSGVSADNGASPRVSISHSLYVRGPGECGEYSLAAVKAMCRRAAALFGLSVGDGNGKQGGAVDMLGELSILSSSLQDGAYRRLFSVAPVYTDSVLLRDKITTSQLWGQRLLLLVSAADGACACRQGGSSLISRELARRNRKWVFQVTCALPPPPGGDSGLGILPLEENEENEINTITTGALINCGVVGESSPSAPSEFSDKCVADKGNSNDNKKPYNSSYSGGLAKDARKTRAGFDALPMCGPSDFGEEYAAGDRDHKYWLEVDPHVGFRAAKREFLARLRIHVASPNMGSITQNAEDPSSTSSGEVSASWGTTATAVGSITPPRPGSEQAKSRPKPNQDLPSLGSFKLSTESKAGPGMRVVTEEEEVDLPINKLEDGIHDGADLQLDCFSMKLSLPAPGTDSGPGALEVDGKQGAPFVVRVLTRHGPNASTAGPGEKGSLLTLAAYPDESLVSLRDRIGAMLLDRPAGWVGRGEWTSKENLGNTKKSDKTDNTDNNTDNNTDKADKADFHSAAGKDLSVQEKGQDCLALEQGAAEQLLGEMAKISKIDEGASTSYTSFSHSSQLALGDAWCLRELDGQLDWRRPNPLTEFVCSKEIEDDSSTTGAGAGGGKTKGKKKGVKGEQDTGISLLPVGVCGVRLQAVTVREAKLCEGSVILLDKGSCPVPGLLNIPLYAWSGEKPFSPSPWADTTGSVNSTVVTSAAASVIPFVGPSLPHKNDSKYYNNGNYGTSESIVDVLAGMGLPPGYCKPLPARSHSTSVLPSVVSTSDLLGLSLVPYVGKCEKGASNPETETETGEATTAIATTTATAATSDTASAVAVSGKKRSAHDEDDGGAVDVSEDQASKLRKQEDEVGVSFEGDDNEQIPDLVPNHTLNTDEQHTLTLSTSPGVRFTPSPPEEKVPGEDALDTSLRTRCAYLRPIGSLLVHEDATLGNVHRTAFSFVYSSFSPDGPVLGPPDSSSIGPDKESAASVTTTATTIGSAVTGSETYLPPPSWENCVLRELRPDLLPGKAFWCCPAESTVKPGAPLSSSLLGSIGKGGGNGGAKGKSSKGPNRGPTDAQRTMKGLGWHMTKDCPLVLETLLAEAEDSVGATAAAAAADNNNNDRSVSVQGVEAEADSREEENQEWTCGTCTFINLSSSKTCDMCASTAPPRVTPPLPQPIATKSLVDPSRILTQTKARPAEKGAFDVWLLQLIPERSMDPQELILEVETEADVESSGAKPSETACTAADEPESRESSGTEKEKLTEASPNQADSQTEVGVEDLIGSKTEEKTEESEVKPEHENYPISESDTERMARWLEGGAFMTAATTDRNFNTNSSENSSEKDNGEDGENNGFESDEPKWPPTRLSISAGDKPTAANVRRACAIAAGVGVYADAGIGNGGGALNTSGVRIFKYMPNKATWTEVAPLPAVSPPSPGGGSSITSRAGAGGQAWSVGDKGKSGGGKSDKAKTMSDQALKRMEAVNVAASPYNVQDGDVLCILHDRDMANQSDNTHTCALLGDLLQDTGLARSQDLALSALLDIQSGLKRSLKAQAAEKRLSTLREDKNKGNQGKAGGVKVAGSKGRAVEAALTIGGTLDFSSDEEEEEEEEEK